MPNGTIVTSDNACVSMLRFFPIKKHGINSSGITGDFGGVDYGNGINVGFHKTEIPAISNLRYLDSAEYILYQNLIKIIKRILIVTNHLL
jgi:hypothetical protein